MSDETGFRRVFVNNEGELRAVWRVAVFIACLILLWLLLGAILGLVGVLIPSVRFVTQPAPAGDQPDAHAISRSVIQWALNLLSAVIATYLCATRLEHRSFASVGFKLHRGWQKLFAVGSVLGAGTIGVAVAIEAALGSAAFQNRAYSFHQLLSSLVPLFIVFLMAAAVEELVFRGFAFQALVHNAGAPFAIAAMSVSFALAHLGNPSPTIISTANTILAGIWLSVAYLATRSLWLSTAMHYSWNLAMVYVFGLPVSGISEYAGFGLLSGQDRPPVWVSGGDYGPEGGIAVTIVLILSTVLIWKSGWFRASAEMAEAIKHGAGEPPYISIINTPSHN